MINSKPKLYWLIFFQVSCVVITVFAQEEFLRPEPQEKESVRDSIEKRDPFIPLMDREGRLRKDFRKPIMAGEIAPRINLMGISKVNNVFYAIVDGKWVKEGDMLGDLTIEKIESDRMILRFGEKKFEVRLYLEKK